MLVQLLKSVFKLIFGGTQAPEVGQQQTAQQKYQYPSQLHQVKLAFFVEI
jgi:hypothetical protein